MEKAKDDPIAEMEKAEPVAWVEKNHLHDDGFTHAFNVQPYATEGYIPLFTHPAQSRNESAEPSAYIWTNNKGWEMYASIPHDEYTNIPLFLHPAQSRDSIIEECAEICDEKHWDDHRMFADAIRALKGK